MTKEDEKKLEESKCPYCGKIFDTPQALGGHKPHCPEGDEYKKIKVKMLSTVSIGSDLQYLMGREYVVTRKFYKNHKFAMVPVRKRK